MGETTLFFLIPYHWEKFFSIFLTDNPPSLKAADKKQTVIPSKSEGGVYLQNLKQSPFSHHPPWFRPAKHI